MHSLGYPAPLQTDMWHFTSVVGRCVAPYGRGVGSSPARKNIDDFWSIFKKVLVFKNRILGNTVFQKTGSYVTGRPKCSGPSRREVKNDVCKYLQTVVMGLYAVNEPKPELAHPDHALSPQGN